MTEETAKLRIPEIAAAQAQKHVTFNEAMTLLDTLVQLSVRDKDLSAPPSTPSEGDCYIVAGEEGDGTASGAWTGWEGRVVRYIDGVWRSYLPGAGDGAGWLAWVQDEDALYRFDGSAWALASAGGGVGIGRNRLINGDMRVAQRGTSFTAATMPANDDDTWLLDRWLLLSDGDDIVDVSRDASDVPSNALYAAKLLVVTPNKKFGQLQIIEQRNCIGLFGNAVTLSFRAKVSDATRLAKCKAAILSWTGAADAVTSDVVSAWNADGVTPTWTAGWTAENTPVDLDVTTSWASYAITAEIDTPNAKNIAVFIIWSDNVTDADAGDSLHITNVQLEAGPAATEFERRHIGIETLLCQGYYQKTGTESGAIGTWTFTTAAAMIAFLPTEMRVNPTVTPADGGDTLTVNCFGLGDATTSSFGLTGGKNSVFINTNTLSPAKTENKPAICKTALACDAEL